MNIKNSHKHNYIYLYSQWCWASDTYMFRPLMVAIIRLYTLK
jgi:hypothetical protein